MWHVWQCGNTAIAATTITQAKMLYVHNRNDPNLTVDKVRVRIIADPSDPNERSRFEGISEKALVTNNAIYSAAENAMLKGKTIPFLVGKF